MTYQSGFVFGVSLTLPMVIQFKDEVTGNNVNTVTTTVYIS